MDDKVGAVSCRSQLCHSQCRRSRGDIVYSLIQSLKTVFFMPVGVCKFEPSCSKYAKEAVDRLPLHIAAAKIVWRVLRCNPFSKGGYDPVIK